MAEINDYLNGLEEQSIQEESKILVVRTPVVEEICMRYKSWLDQAVNNWDYWHQIDTFTSKSIKGLRYSSKDILNFSIYMKEYESHKDFYKSGVFISMLINNSEENDFVIITGHLIKKLFWLGFDNSKNIVVRGSAGDLTGMDMRSNILTITGNVGTRSGLYSRGGEIHICGNIGEISPPCKAKIYQNGELIWPR